MRTNIHNLGLKGSAFLSAVWISLIVIFVCALTPTGEPRTRFTGSAFDPSTTVVTLRGRTEQLQQAEPFGAKADQKSALRASQDFLPFIVPDSLQTTSRLSAVLPHRWHFAPNIATLADFPFSHPPARAPPTA